MGDNWLYRKMIEFLICLIIFMLVFIPVVNFFIAFMKKADEMNQTLETIQEQNQEYENMLKTVEYE